MLLLRVQHTLTKIIHLTTTVFKPRSFSYEIRKNIFFFFLLPHVESYIVCMAYYLLWFDFNFSFFYLFSPFFFFCPFSDDHALLSFNLYFPCFFVCLTGQSLFFFFFFLLTCLVQRKQVTKQGSLLLWHFAAKCLPSSCCCCCCICIVVLSKVEMKGGDLLSNMF